MRNVGPVVVAIEANNLAFIFYLFGVILGGCGTNLDHAVTIVGYGNEFGLFEYWIVKNSWGWWWGWEGGYFRIRKTNTNDAGVCGINMQPLYATV